MRVKFLMLVVVFFGINTTNINAQIRFDKPGYISSSQGSSLPTFCENRSSQSLHPRADIAFPMTSVNSKAYAPTKSNVNFEIKVIQQPSNNYHDKIPDAYDRAQRMVNAVSADQRWCVYKQLDSMVPSLTSYLRSCPGVIEQCFNNVHFHQIEFAHFSISQEDLKFFNKNIVSDLNKSLKVLK